MTRRTRRGGRPSVVIRAVLAFGLVFGVGAAVTDAAWTDQEYANSTFTAATFGIQGSTDGTNFSDHATSATAATLTFNATAMYPGLTVAAPWVVRTTTGSLAGTAVLSQPAAPTGNAGLIADLLYRVYADTSAGCTTTSTPSANGVWVSSNGASFVPLSTAPLTTARNLGASTAAPLVYYCFQVQLSTASANADQGQSATATWLVTGTNAGP